MSSFLIVHCALHDGRLDAYRQPPTLDIAGSRAPLDWGDITLQVPAGDLPVTVSVTRTNGQVEGATILLRTPAGTGTRLTFVPPLQPGGGSMLRIDGQWPADSSMHYYAARDARVLQQPTEPAAPTTTMREPGQPGQPRQQRRADAQAGVRVVSPAAETPVAPTPPVGPTPGSTGSVPPQPSPFGREQGARVDPVQPSAELPVHRAPLAQPPHLGPRPGPSAPQRPGRGEPGPLGGHPTHPSQHQPQHPSQPPSFGQRPQRTERDVYGREHAADDRQPPPIPTPAEFHRLEQEAAEAQRRVYDAWQAQQRAQHAQAGPTPHDGVPQPIGLAAGIGQAQPSWYPDPFRRAESRWFDGRQWTASVMRGGVRGTDQPG